MDKQIYKFTFDEVKELTYNQLKIFSIIRQFSIDNVSKIYVDEIVRRTKLVKTNVYKDIRVLQSKHYLCKEDKEYIILKPISKGEQFLYWIDNDLSLGLTYNQFVLYCLIRTNSNKFGYAMLKYSTITDLVGITKNNISRTVKELIEKGLIRAERQDTYAKYWTIEKSKYEECLDNSSENVEELPKEIQLIVAEDKKEETIYDKIAGIFGWDALPKIGVGLVDACYQTYNDAEVDIGTIIYGCLRQTRYRISTNAEFKNKSAEFVYWWKCAETEIKKSYTYQVRQKENLDRMAAAEAQEDEEERKRIEKFKQKRDEEMRNEKKEEPWFLNEMKWY